MYSKYQIEGISIDDQKWLEIGMLLEKDKRSEIRKSLDSFLSPAGEVDAAFMMSKWFPEEKFDVFISHSRKDKDLAFKLSGLLKDCFDLTSFIDSCVWSHADELLKKIDDRWCYQSATENYSYESRNVTTSHVHMMLATALTQMMDRCECVFFLNTENSIRNLSPHDMINSGDEMTQSAWLFHEISMMKMLRRRGIEKHRPKVTHFSEGKITKADAGVPDFNYPSDLTEIPSLGKEELDAWMSKWKPFQEKMISKHDTHPLDLLYGIKSPEPE